MPLREALRGLRHVMRRGGATFRDTLSVDMLPRPAAELAGSMLRDAEHLARGADRIASDLANKVLGTSGLSPATLDELAATGNDGALFAAGAYPALGSILGRLGVDDAFISEAAARTAFSRALAQARESEPGTERHDLSQPNGNAQARLGAALTLAMIETRTLRGLSGARDTRVPPAALEPVALFALMLWLQSNARDDENAAALSAATDLSVVLADDIATAVALRDAERLAALYTEFASHV
jgi:hypothetical protein